MIIEEIKHINQNYNDITEIVQNPMLLSLNEGKYLAPKVQECFECFYKALKPNINMGINNIHIGYDAFKWLNTFFKDADINISIDLDDKYVSPTHNWYSSFYGNQGGGSYECLKMDGTTKTDSIHLRSILASAFYHEYQHVYEDYCRQQKYLDNSLPNYSIVSNYVVYGILQNKYGEIGEDIAYILCHLAQVEQRAFIAGGVGEIEQYMKSKFSNRFKSPHEIAKTTKNYENIQKLWEKLAKIEAMNDTNTPDVILADINQYSGVQGMVHGKALDALKDNDINTLKQLKVKKFRFKSWAGFVSFLQGRVKKVYADYMNAISKAINQRNIGSLYSLIHPF